MAIKANIVIDQGTDFQAVIDVENSDGSPFDLRDFTPEAQIRKTYASSTAYDFIVSDNGDLGQITLKMPKATTSVLEPGRYLYDIIITADSTGTTARVVEGICTVTAGITRNNGGV